MPIILVRLIQNALKGLTSWLLAMFFKPLLVHRSPHPISLLVVYCWKKPGLSYVIFHTVDFVYCILLMSLILSSILYASCKLVIVSKGQYLFKPSKQQTKMVFTYLGSQFDGVTISRPSRSCFSLFRNADEDWREQSNDKHRGFHPTSEGSAAHSQGHLTLMDNFTLFQRKGNFCYEIKCKGFWRRRGGWAPSCWTRTPLCGRRRERGQAQQHMDIMDGLH